MSERLLLVRHAEASGQHPDADLTPLGHRQADLLSDRLRHLNVDGVVSSPYLRARNTAAPFANTSGCAVDIVDDLRERVLASGPVPDWLEHVRRSFEDFDYAIRDGESMNETRDRALDALRQIQALGHRFPAVISHGNLIASILCRLKTPFGFDDWRAMKNPDLFLLTFDNGTPVTFVNVWGRD